MCMFVLLTFIGIIDNEVQNHPEIYYQIQVEFPMRKL